MPVFIQDYELLVGSPGSKPRGGYLNPETSWSILDDEIDTISTRRYDPFLFREEDKKTFLEEIKPYWEGRSFLEKWRKLLPEEARKLRDNGYMYIDRKAVRGFGEATPGWDRLLGLGISGIRK